VNPRYWAWFDVHRARLWQMVAASLLLGGVTFAVAVIAVAPFTGR